MRKRLALGFIMVLGSLIPDVSSAQSDPTYPNYRIRYLADIVQRDEGNDHLIEEGVFNTSEQAEEVINLLAHLAIAWHVDCACEEIRRDVLGVEDLEDDLMGMLTAYGYVSRLVPASEVSSLPDYVGVLTPYLILNGEGFRDDVSPEAGDLSWIATSGQGSTATLDPSNPQQYARVDDMGIFVDTRLSAYLQDRVNQVLGGYILNDAVSLCAFAALERSPDDMMSWVLIRDLRRTWSEGDEP